jgi:hypothetical protein
MRFQPTASLACARFAAAEARAVGRSPNHTEQEAKMKAKTLTVIALLAVLALTMSGPATGLARQSASSPADSQNIAIASNSYFDDFSTYPVGSVPSGWTQYGTSAIVPTVVNFMGTGPAFQRLDFPAYTAQSTSKWLIRDGFTWATVTASVKINFQTASDGAGLVLAWVDNNNFIAVLPNALLC